MKVIKRKKRTINEDDVQTNNNNNTTDTSQEVKTNVQQENNLKSVNDNIVQLLKQKHDLKNQYYTAVKPIEAQLIQYAKQQADLGENVDINLIESYSKAMKISFWRKLCEATINRTDEMLSLIKISFYQVDNLSYTPDDTWCKTLARRIIEYINDTPEQELNRDTMIDFITDRVNAGRISLSSREKTEFINKLIENLESSPLFRKYIITDNEE